jgi:hypothetical protein
MFLYGPGRILKKKTYALHKGPIYIEVGEPIGREQLAAMGDTKAQAKQVRQLYINRYAKIANEIERE